MSDHKQIHRGHQASAHENRFLRFDADEMLLLKNLLRSAALQEDSAAELLYVELQLAERAQS